MVLDWINLVLQVTFTVLLSKSSSYRQLALTSTTHAMLSELISKCLVERHIVWLVVTLVPSRIRSLCSPVYPLSLVIWPFWVLILIAWLWSSLVMPAPSSAARELRVLSIRFIRRILVPLHHLWEKPLQWIHRK